MCRLNAMDIYWQKVEVIGKEGLFTDFRVDRNTVPKDWYLYEVRHDDWCQGDPVEISLGVLVNFWGTLIMKEPLPLEPLEDGNAYLYIDHEKDWNYLDEYSIELEES